MREYDIIRYKKLNIKLNILMYYLLNFLVQYKVCVTVKVFKEEKFALITYTYSYIADPNS